MQLSSCDGNRLSLIFPNISALGPQLQLSVFLMGTEVKGSPFAVAILEEVDPRNCVVQGAAVAVAGDDGGHFTCFLCSVCAVFVFCFLFFVFLLLFKGLRALYVVIDRFSYVIYRDMQHNLIYKHYN